MALIACPDCNTQVSDAAPACPKCSRPIKATTIESTGKQWKGMRLIGAGIVLLSILATITSDGVSVLAVLMLIVGVALLATSSIGAWWQHG